MAALAAQADVEASLLRELTANEEIYIAALLARVSRQVRVYTGQFIEEASETVIISADLYGTLRLPQRPVTAIGSLVINGDELDANSYEFTPDGVISGVWADGFETNIAFGWLSPVTVTYTHGYDPIPDDIVGVVADIVANRLGSAGSSSGSGTVKRAEVDDVRIEYDTSTATSANDGFTDEQRQTLDAYRNIGRPINMVSRRAL